jgi:hypothetical protein
VDVPAMALNDLSCPMKRTGIIRHAGNK